jgi:hypothetical protein
LGNVVHTVKRAGTYAAKVSHKELHKIAVHVRAVEKSAKLVIDHVANITVHYVSERTLF